MKKLTATNARLQSPAQAAEPIDNLPLIQKITALMPGLVCVYNINTGKYIYVNDTVTKMLGYTKEEWLEKGQAFVSTLVHPDDIGQIMKKNVQALKMVNAKQYQEQGNEPIVAFEYRVKHKNGSWRWIKTDGVVFDRNGKGKVEHVMNISVDITERKEAELHEATQRKQIEQKLHDTILKTNTVLEQFSEGYFEMDTNWRYRNINKKGEMLAQKTKNELLGKRWFDVFPEVKDTHFFSTAKKVMRTQKAATTQEYFAAGDTWYENSYYPLVDGIAIFSKDITYQKKLGETEKYLSAIVASSDDAIISKNLNSIITSWNGAAEKMWGYTAQEVVGKSITIIIPPELRKDEVRIIRQIKQGKRIDHFETIRMRKDGTRLIVSLTISPIKDENGKIIGASKIARDITKQKQIEQNLQFLSEANRILSSSLDYNVTLQSVAEIAVPHIGDWCGIDILDERGELQQVAVAHKDPKKVAWAKAYRKVTPPDMTEMSGVPKVIKTGMPELYPLITDEMLVAMAKSEKELKLVRSLNFTSVMIVPIKLKEKTIGAISLVTTETRRQYTPSDLVMAQELATRASLAIENATLYTQAQKEIELRKRLEKQKDDFIGIASHELKTPVTSIKAFAQVLRLRFKKEGNNFAADLLGKLDAQVDKLTSLIGDLLDVTKIEAGKMAFNESYFSFDELVDELQEELQRTTDKHVLRIKGKTNKKILGDRERLGQVITNLVSNAIKYSPHTKEIIIHLDVTKGNVRLCVQDFGIGIPKDKQEKVFERFFRASGPGQDTYPGLGLGLYVSSEIIKRLDGRIWVESIEGKGSTFCFSLPIHRKPAKKPEKSMDEVLIQHE